AFFNLRTVEVTKAALIVLCSAPLCLSAESSAAKNSDTQAKSVWRAKIEHTPLPSDGCFTATYPSVSWDSVSCVPSPPKPMVPKLPPAGRKSDYMADA